MLCLTCLRTEMEPWSYDAYVSELDKRLRYAYRAVKAHLGRAANRAKLHYDLRVKRSRYEIGEWVSYYNPRYFRGREDKWSRKFSGPFLVIEVLPPVNLKLQRSPSAKPFIVHYDRVKFWEGEVPKSWLRNVPEHEEFDILDLLLSLDIEASVATEQAQDLPVDADAVISNKESEAGDETGNVTEIDRDQPVKVDECVDRASEAQSVEVRPKRVHRRPAYLEDYYGQ